MKKMCISVSDFYIKIINNKHTLLYNLPTIHSIQRYNGLFELTTCAFNTTYTIQSSVNCPMQNNVYKCIGFLHENDQKQAYTY